MITKKLSILSLAFGLMLAPLPFLLRTDNVLYAVFEQNSQTLLFVIALAMGALVAAVSIFRTSHHITQRFLVLVAGLLVAAGLALVPAVEAGYFLAVVITPVSGCILGVALVFLLYRLGVLLSACSPWSIVLPLCSAFLCVSVVWFALKHLQTSLFVCLSLGALCFMGAVLFYFAEKRLPSLTLTRVVPASYADAEMRKNVIADGLLGSQKSKGVVNERGAGAASGATQVSVRNTARVNDEVSKEHRASGAGAGAGAGASLSGTARNRRALAYYWAGFYGIAFNFFTLGLTFWPQNAGLPENTGALSKPLAYLIIGLSIVAINKITPFVSQREANTFYHAALPIGAAIVLASPFLDSLLPTGAFFVISCISYIGIALLNVLGFAASLWAQQLTQRKYADVFLLLVGLCVGAFLAGLAVFYCFGQQAQIISLCVLALFLALMVVTAMKNGYNEQTQGEQPQESALLSSAKRVVEEFGLSPREAEILEYLAKGRGAKYVGEKLFISSETVRTHAKRIYEKTGVHTKEELLDLLERYQ